VVLMSSILKNRCLSSLVLLLSFLLVDAGLQAQKPALPQTAMQEREQAAEDTFSKYGTALVDNDYEKAYKTWSIDSQLSTPYGAFVTEQREIQARFGKLQRVQNSATFMPNGIRHYPLGTIAFVRARLTYQFDVVIVTYEFHYEGDRWVISKSKRVPLKSAPRGLPSL
jgi:hypothetical protein